MNNSDSSIIRSNLRAMEKRAESMQLLAEMVQGQVRRQRSELAAVVALVNCETNFPAMEADFPRDAVPKT